MTLFAVIRISFTRLPQWRRRIFYPVPGAKSPWFLQCPNLCGEAGVGKRHVDRCWCKEGDEWLTGWVCHPEAGLLDSLASRISVELIVEGSRFPRLLCSVWVMLSHRWFCPCHMPHAIWSESATAACRKRLPNIWVKGPVEPWSAFSRTFLHVSTELSL
jgi:hypothetical protein